MLKTAVDHIFGLTHATGIGRETAQIHARYTVELAKASGFLLPQAGQEDRRPAARLELNRLAGFILDRGSYPWDVVS